MPVMRTTDPLIAILCSDIHLSIKPPIAREEEDWWQAMRRPLGEICGLGSKYDIPTICAGDIFDKWKSPPELINFALKYLPDMYAIPGQHDLPFHNHELIEKSAYWTLVKAGKITPILPGSQNVEDHLRVYGFPWGVPVFPLLRTKKTKRLQVAVVHRYLWIPGCKYPGASKDSKLTASQKSLKGYDVAVFGDNHQGFLVGNVFNCGTLMRRKSDEAKYTPHVGLLHASGKIDLHYLDISEDILTAAVEEEVLEDNEQVEAFLEELERLKASDLDFQDTLTRMMDRADVKPSVRQIILEAMK